MNSERTSFTIPRRRYLSEEVADIIKDRIFSLEFSPGERLIVDTLAQEIQVSMTPIREGLKELVSQGLVTYDGKSYSVFDPSPADVENLHRIRRYLEQLAASLAAERMDPEVVDGMMGMIREFVSSDKTGDSNTHIELDQLFHRSILEATGNERLQNMLSTIQEQTWLIRHWGFAHSYEQHIAEYASEEHLAILQAIRDRDPQKAEALMRDHLVHAEDMSRETLGM